MKQTVKQKGVGYVSITKLVMLYILTMANFLPHLTKTFKFYFFLSEPHSITKKRMTKTHLFTVNLLVADVQKCETPKCPQQLKNGLKI